MVPVIAWTSVKVLHANEGCLSVLVPSHTQLKKLVPWSCDGISTLLILTIIQLQLHRYGHKQSWTPRMQHQMTTFNRLRCWPQATDMWLLIVGVIKRHWGPVVCQKSLIRQDQCWNWFVPKPSNVFCQGSHYALLNIIATLWYGILTSHLFIWRMSCHPIKSESNPCYC